VVTHTNDVRGVGTDAAVFVELLGASGASGGRKPLLSPSPEVFARGRVDEFRLRCPALGELAKLRIGHDGKGGHPAWHLAKVSS
jgi:hypothetical protein